MTLEELKEEKAMLEQTRKNILEGGQEFQTHDGRVRQVDLNTVLSRLAAVDQAIASYGGARGNTDTVLLKFGGMG